jgi:ankyrin repeat protein
MTEVATDQPRNLYSYPHYKGIWKEIDNNSLVNLSNHADLESKINQYSQGHTPLFLACLRKNVEMVKFLLHCGADPNLGVCRHLIVTPPLIPVRRVQECCPFIFVLPVWRYVRLSVLTACSQIFALLEVECVAELLEGGALPNTACTSRKIAPLHLAAHKGL